MAKERRHYNEICIDHIFFKNEISLKKYALFREKLLNDRFQFLKTKIIFVLIFQVSPIFSSLLYTYINTCICICLQY